MMESCTHEFYRRMRLETQMVNTSTGAAFTAFLPCEPRPCLIYTAPLKTNAIRRPRPGDNDG